MSYRTHTYVNFSRLIFLYFDNYLWNNYKQIFFFTPFWSLRTDIRHIPCMNTINVFKSYSIFYCILFTFKRTKKRFCFIFKSYFNYKFKKSLCRCTPFMLTRWSFSEYYLFRHNHRCELVATGQLPPQKKFERALPLIFGIN